MAGVCMQSPVVLKAFQSSGAVRGADTVVGPSNKLHRVLESTSLSCAT